jgi:hypothetical protein
MAACDERLLAHLPPSRTVAVPAPHAGVGLGVYAKATSPLRRYSDVIVHRQLRAFAAGGPLPWNAEALAGALPTLAERERAVARAQALSERYWTLVHLGMSMCVCVCHSHRTYAIRLGTGCADHSLITWRCIYAARDPPTAQYDALVLNAAVDAQGLVPVLLMNCALRARARPLSSLLVHTL